MLTEGDVGALVRLAGTVPDSDGVTLVPAFAGLGAPHWDRSARALISGMTSLGQSRLTVRHHEPSATALSAAD